MITSVSGTQYQPATTPVSSNPPATGKDGDSGATTVRSQPQDSAVFSQAALKKAQEAKEQSQAGEANETASQESQEGSSGGSNSPQSLVNG